MQKLIYNFDCSKINFNELEKKAKVGKTYNNVKEFVENINEEECDKNMFLLPERVKIWYNEDIAKAKNEGKTEGKASELLKLAKKMIKDNMDIELIKRYTGYSAKQIEDLKKSMS